MSEKGIVSLSSIACLPEGTLLVHTHSTIFQATLGLRIKAGRLQQLWVGMSHGEHDWRDVPVEE